MMKKYLFFLAVLVMSGMAVVAQHVQELPYVSMDVEDFEEHIQSRSVTLVDVRTAKEFAEDHIAGAVNIEWGPNFSYYLQKAKLKKGSCVAVYCRSGRRSKEAAKELAKRGFSVVELNYGINGWKQAAKPVVHSWGRSAE